METKKNKVFKHYYIESELTFGKYNGKSIEQIIEIQPSYIEWCILNLEHFFVSEDSIEEIKEIYPAFTLSEKAESILNEKLQEIIRLGEEAIQAEEFRDFCIQSEEDSYYALTGGQHGQYGKATDIDSVMDKMGY
jgi:hypothetical protein